MTIGERLAARLKVMPSGCMEWQGSQSGNGGYGRIWRGPNDIPYVHRVAWELAHGPIPDGLHVLHRCDNRPCCNPDHLFLGTNNDNIADKIAKGRQPHGVMIAGAKLTPDDVRRVRALRAEGWLHKDIAVAVGCSRTNVHGILHGVLWRSVA